MINRNPILIVEDDHDDCELIQSAFKEIGVENEFKCFINGEEALKFLHGTSADTFLILSDVNMPRLNGFELKKAINDNDRLKKKAIPFVFLSTSQSKKDVSEAYDLAVQGFFKKPNNFEALKNILKTVTYYWDTCLHPNSN